MTKFTARMNKIVWFILVAIALCPVFVLQSCKQGADKKAEVENKVLQMDPAKTAQLSASITSLVKPVLADSLTVSLWGIDSLVVSPIAIDIDDLGNIYYATTNRQKNSEFDIRGHQDWEIPSIQLQTIDDKRAFLRKVLSPENSKNNGWLKDLNGDSSHDWKDLTIEKENIFRVSDLNGDGVADKSQLVVNEFHDEVTDVVGGLLVEGKEMFLAVGPDLWRMKDKDGDGIQDEKESISTGYGIHIGFSGHGMSGVEMGPDGRIYWQIGDIGFNGKDKEGKAWSSPNSGVIVRSNPDGSDFEIFASGLRNTHEFAFDEYANLISEDNDGDHAGEKERLVYVVNGSDAGWRSNWQYGKYRDPDNNTYKVWMDEKMWLPRFKGQAAYITPCISNFVSGPAGFVYNPGTALSPKYKNTFFVAEFVGNPSQSGVHSFKLKPKGASFELGENKMVFSGVLPTGLDFGPDGALYVADWIDGWGTKNYGRIWKMDDKDAASLAERKLTKTLLGTDFTKSTDADLQNILLNPDMRVRLKAQFELVKRGAKGAAVFQKALGQTANQLARVHAIWGISQMARKDKQYAGALLPVLQDKDPEMRAQAAKWLGDIKFKEAVEKLLPLLKDADSRCRFFAAEALGRIMYEPAINPLIELLRQNNDEDAYIRHAGSLALARIGKATPLIALAKDKSTALRIAAVVALRKMGDVGITAFLDDSDEFVVTETARAINDDLSISGALPALGKMLSTTIFKNEALVRRSINANLRVGTDEALQILIAYAIKEGNPAGMRAEAIEAISTWAKPSVVDRVDGRYRGVVVRDPASVRNSAGEPLVQLLSNKETAVRISAVKAVQKLDIRPAAPVLLGLLKKDGQPTIRVSALQALASMKDEHMGEAIKLAIGDKDKSVRIAGLGLMEKMDIEKGLMVTLLSDVINNKTAEEKQAALLTLGKLPLANTNKVFDGLLQQMASGKLSPDIHLELAEAIDSTRSPELSERYNQIGKKLSPDTLMAAYAGSLFGGDPESGRSIFFRNENAQCLRCHSYDDLGGNAGPRLNGVGARLTRPLILESLINPSARLAPGFGVVILELKDGKKISGYLVSENASGLTLKIGEQKETFAKDQVAKRTNAASSMPDMKALLTKKEIRDVVSFLTGEKDVK